ncbi:MAG: sugar transferase [Anaerolineales bacterium]|jgi:lipopolysaccharide/colanic/teichoic acid biosynthesis glycosyltransferase
MARNYVSTTEERAQWRFGWRASLTWGAAAALTMLTWGYFGAKFSGSAGPAGFLLSLAVLQAGLTLALERAISYTPIRRVWRYRLAFLASLALAAVHIVLYPWLLAPESATSFGFSTAIILLGVTALSAFGGGLIATAVNGSLWENNSPPQMQVQVEVHQRHIAVIGFPGRGPLTKRVFDLLLAFIGLIVSAPVWTLSAFLVWFEDPGPVMFVKNSVGKGGLNFHQFKFRTMQRSAESHTGPILARQGDERVLRIGRLLRKTALDELPQLLNIIKGEMSFVGPRPQRTVLVNGYLQRMPEYAERHRVRPGLAGLAQVAGDYYLTPRQKLRFDRLYIGYISLGFDLKLILLAFLIAFWFRWQQDWNGRLPRRLLRYRWGRSL